MGVLKSLFGQAQNKRAIEERSLSEDTDKIETILRIDRRIQVYLQKKQTLIMENVVLIKQYLDLAKKKPREELQKNPTYASLIQLLRELITLNGFF